MSGQHSLGGLSAPNRGQWVISYHGKKEYKIFQPMPEVFRFANSKTGLISSLCVLASQNFLSDTVKYEALDVKGESLDQQAVQ